MSIKMKDKEFIKEEIEIPEGIVVEIENDIVKVKGQKGENQKKLFNPSVSISKENKKVILVTKNNTKREKKLTRTFKAHIKNLIKGATENYIYKLKICSGHFPINVSVEGNFVVIKNFFGEKIPRKARILQNINVKVEGDEIFVEGADKEAAGQTASNIEMATKRVNFDRRIFQDGIYIVNKAGRELR